MKLKYVIEQYPFLLPTLAAIFAIFTLPPYQWSSLIFFSFAPLIYAVRNASHVRQALLYGFLFGFIFSTYVTFSVLNGFHWFENAEIFVWIMYGVGFLIVLLSTVFSGLVSVLTYRLRTVKTGFFVLAATFLFFLVDVVLTTALSGFNYGSVQFSIAEQRGVLELLPLLPIEFFVGLVFLINVLWAEALYKKSWILALLALLLLLSFYIPVPYLKSVLDAPKEALTVALIQDQERDADVVFGKTINGVFKSEHLADRIAEAAAKQPDIIVYPFNPWVGVMIEDGQMASFNKDIIAVTESQFNTWLQSHVPPEIVFVTWYTASRNGSFYNEIGYWKNGIKIGEYQKQALFPFFDYTPQFAQQAGVYTTPYDGSSGNKADPVIVNGVSAGAVVCSEITNQNAIAQSVGNADVLFSIGSEAMFTNELPAAYNYLQSKIIASTYRTPVVRSTKFGPSGVFGAHGETLGTMPYGEEGVLVVDIPLSQ